jgi:NAD(P)-dependent dehydrogenase (short-subunit alcohol dehydrogenase family)
MHIVISGATKGLGRALTSGFIEEGHKVYGCGRSKNCIDKLNRDYSNLGCFEIVDVTVDSQVQRWAKKVLKQGPPDLLINNAGYMNTNAPLWEISDNDFTKVMDVNIRGTANVIRSFAPAMVKRKKGVIVNFSSTWGYTTSPEVAPYCASKWAIEGLTRSLAEELPKGMAAVALNPGIINTAMLKKTFGSAAEDYPDPVDWAAQAVPFILKLGKSHNGKSVEVGI